MESNAKGQIAKGNEIMSFKIGDQVLYNLHMEATERIPNSMVLL